MKNQRKVSVPCLVLMLIVAILYILPMIIGGTKNAMTQAVTITAPGMISLKAALFALIAAAVIAICAPMAAWYITRAGGAFGKVLLCLFALAIVVPGALIRGGMFDCVDGLPIPEAGLGMGVTILACCAYIRLLPVEPEETAAMEGHGALSIFFGTVMPMLRPVVILMGATCAAWIFNGFLMVRLSFAAINAVSGIILAIVFALQIRKTNVISE